ncbi:MAG TPA: hypothetical protein VET25_07425, partial [Aestuariivirgaceae bacterium]|nr:hypothetical protein [Aestuariivirgaceae bacterium]
DWVKDIAEAAAKMSRTKLQIQIETDNHELLPNRPISQLVQANMEQIGAPKFTESEHEFARALQQPLEAEFKKKFEVPLREKIEPLPAQPDSEKGSTDVADVSWHVPTGGLKAVCFVADAPGHSWQNVATIGSPIGHKGTLFAAKVLAATAVDLLEDSKNLHAAREDFDERMKEKKYSTLIPKGQKAPRSIR